MSNSKTKVIKRLFILILTIWSDRMPIKIADGFHLVHLAVQFDFMGFHDLEKVFFTILVFVR